MGKVNALTSGLDLAASGLTVRRPAEPRRVNQVLGSSVRLRDSIGFGRVEDFVLNEEGCIEYAVVSREGRYGLFPWSAARIDYEQHTVTYDVTSEAVQPLFFPRDAWPDRSDTEFLRRMCEAFSSRAVQLDLRPVGRVTETLPRVRTPVKFKVGPRRRPS